MSDLPQIPYKSASMCINSSWAKGFNEAVEQANPQMFDLYARIVALEDAQRWISVDERLPESGDVYFVMRRAKDASTSTFIGGEWYIVGKPTTLHDITHWKPINPPTEE